MPDITEEALVDEGAIPPEDFHDAIERIQEVAHWELEIPADLPARIAAASSRLLIDPLVVAEAAAALAVGHLVLQGPPGTGKSTLCRSLCQVFGVETLPVTAHEDWSTFEVIGRQELRASSAGEEIIPVNGFFTEAVIRCAGAIVRHFDEPSEPQATWLFIDELNRAEPDKAFGELFSILGTTDSVAITLPHQTDGNRVLVTPKRFRIIASMNSIDRDFVKALSQGLRRRFTFITLDVPGRRLPNERWGSDAENASLSSKEFLVVTAAALDRASNRIQPGAGNAATVERIRRIVEHEARGAIEELFAMVEKVRFSGNGSVDIPHLPIGTAPLIDTVELFLTRLAMSPDQQEDLPQTLDWAASVKIVPLFDVGSVNRDSLRAFASTLPTPFDRRTRLELLRIAAEGMYFVE